MEISIIVVFVLETWHDRIVLYKDDATMKVRREMSRNARDIFSQGTWNLSRASHDISRWNILAVSRLCQCETIQWHFRYTWKRTRAISRSWIFQPFHLIRTKKMIFSQCLEFHWKISYPRWPVPSPSKSMPRKILRALQAVCFISKFRHCIPFAAACIYTLRIQMNSTGRSIAPSRLSSLFVSNVFSPNKYRFR